MYSFRLAAFVWEGHCAAMTMTTLTFLLPNPDDTTTLASQISKSLSPGDCLLLEGPIGAGKTHFARALIQSRLGREEDVPSPTFTLVQCYDLPETELWHADLYRLTSLDEIEELGLSEAMETAICLIEWPDRLGEYWPSHALHLSLSLVPQAEDARQITITFSDEKWQNLIGQVSKEYLDEQS